jgi:ferric-dicitrate binding protein FerR (iron transport regulator)
MKTAGLVVAGGLALIGAGLALRRWRRTVRRKGRLAPVRAEAARWLGRLRDGEVDPAMRTDLTRLRFGPPVAWPAAEPVFRRARRAWRQSRRRVIRTRP